MTDKRVALIGYGLAGAVIHAPLIEAAPGLRLAAVVTSDAGRSARAEARHRGAEVLPSADDVWTRAGDLDAVVVASPNSSHMPLARQAIDLGLPVVVDKPLAPTADGAQALVEEAASRGVPLTVFQNRRWDSDQLTLRKLIADGSLGDVHRYESRFERWRPELRGDAWRESTDPAEGGGVLLDLGAHLVDQALELFGEALEVHGEVAARRGASDDDAFIAISHPGGVESHLWASSVAAAPGPRLRVLGSRAAFIVPEVDGQEAALKEGGDPAAADWGAEPSDRWGSLVTGDEREPVPSENGAWPRFYELFARALEAGGPVPVDPADAVAALRVLERASG